MVTASTPAGDRPSLRRLIMFDAVVRRGGVTAAAAQVGVSQPAVTIALGKLEAELGEVLVRRGAGGSVTTPVGAIFHRRVRRMLEMIEDAARAAGPQGEARRAANVVHSLTDAQIRDHLAVAEAGSFRRAADRLAIAEPTLSRSVRGLEAVIGAPLYRRAPFGFEVTAQGAALATRLRVALAEIDQGLDELAFARGEAGGRLAVGCLPLMPKPLLARAMGALIRARPGVEIALQESTYEHLSRDLAEASIDLVLGALRGRTDIHEAALFDDPYVLVVGPNHPALSGPAPGVRQLARLPWLIPWRGTPRRAALEAFFARFPRRPHVVMETSSLATLQAVLAESEAVTLLSRSQVESSETARPLRELSAIGAQARAVGVATRRSWLPTEVQSLFVDLLVQEARSYRASPA